MAAIANDLDFTKVVLLNADTLNSAALIGSYPMGVSTMTLSSTQSSAGSWPLASSASVWTYRPGSGLGVQYFYENNFNNERIFYRVMGASNGAWLQVSTAKVASGTVGIPMASSAYQSIAVTFPTGLFTTAPAVVGSTEDSAYFGGAYSRTATGCRVYARQYAGTTSSNTINVNWVATA